MQEPYEKNERRRVWLSASGHVVMYMATLFLCALLIGGAYRAFVKGFEVKDEKVELQENIDYLKAQISAEETLAINRLDPDYREAEERRETNKLREGEELLPIYMEGRR